MSDKEFESTISDFYQELASKQQPLGQDFEKVLIDNLWDLYEDSQTSNEVSVDGEEWVSGNKGIW